MTARNDAPKADFFISRTGADKEVAKAIAQIIRDAGFSAFYQDEDFGHASFMRRMEQAFEGGARTVALLSRDYQQSEYCRKEYNVALSDDPGNLNQRLIVLRIDDCQPTGNLKDIAYTDISALLTDATELARVVRGAIGAEQTPKEVAFWKLHLRSPVQIRHPEIREVKDFIGREEQLAVLDKALWGKEGTSDLTNSGPSATAIRGLGGVGKTILARQYAWLNRERYHGVWWIRAQEPGTLLDDLVELGDRLIPNLRQTTESRRGAEITADRIAQMQTAKPWLLVYDNCETPATLDKLTPAQNAQILITSQWSDWHGHATELPVGVFPLETAVDYLMEHTRHPDRNAAERLAKDLGRLPVALSHARAYCWHSGWSFDEYREQIAEMIRHAPRSNDYPESVYATFSLAIRKSTESCEKAEHLINLLAFTAPDRIPLSLVAPEFESEVGLSNAVIALNELSLLEHEPTMCIKSVSVHRLVQRVAQEQLKESGKFNDYSARVTKLVASAFVQDGDMKGLEINAHLFPHAAAVLSSAPRTGPNAWHTLCIYDRVADFRLNHGDSPQALCDSKNGLAIATNLSKAEPNNTHWQRSHSVFESKIGDALIAQGKLADALKHLNESKAIKERLTQLHRNNPQLQYDLSNAYDRIGYLFFKQETFDKALENYSASRRIRVCLLRSFRSDEQLKRYLAVSLALVGDALTAQGLTDAALRKFRKSKTIRERLIQDTPNLLALKHELATSYEKIGDIHLGQGNLTKAIASYQQSFDITEDLSRKDRGNVNWQRELSISHLRLGDVFFRMALAGHPLDQVPSHQAKSYIHYQDSLRIVQNLVDESKYPNVEWLRDLSISLERVGTILWLQGKTNEGLHKINKSLTIGKELSNNNSDNAELKRDLSCKYERIGDIEQQRGNIPAAIEAYEKSLPIAQSLADKLPDHPQFQSDIAITKRRLEDLKRLKDE